MTRLSRASNLDLDLNILERGKLLFIMGKYFRAWENIKECGKYYRAWENIIECGKYYKAWENIIEHGKYYRV